MKIMRMCVIVCVFAVLTQGYARAQESGQAAPKEADRRGRMENYIREVYNQLNLTEEQKKQLDENKNLHHKLMNDLHGESRSLKGSLNRLLMQPDMDMNKINSIQSRLKNIESEKIDDRLNSILEVRKILTPGQFAKFFELTGKHDKVSKEKGPR
ncbi:MAG: periplasmic heavy metal sensor [Candidatus Omnitrophota bacterium]